MQFLNSLYSIESKEVSDSSVTYHIFLDGGHVVYRAHFPGNPITPGVCIIQITKELMEDHLKQSLDIQRVKNVKFLRVISPLAIPRVTYQFTAIATDFSAQGFRTQVQVLAGDSLLAKLSFTCCAPN